jgi:nucleotide-binding universal stress UspA family protein
MLRKILVPTDFSPSASAALETACELARGADAELLLLHVQDGFPFISADGSGYLPPEVVRQIEETADSLLAAQVDEARARGIRVRGQRVLGAAHVQIATIAEREQVDMIVMGSHGRRGLRRLMMGSVAERVARTAHVPVLMIPTALEHRAG